jgi:SSS family solute:Na+ symporter
MIFTTLDYIAFISFISIVVIVSLYVSRGKEDSEDYFLAGRNLSWWVIGLSLVASNISSEHFIGQAGQGFRDGIGLAIASWEWIAVFTLVITALFLLPKFLQLGIYTMPQYLEHRYDRRCRTFMSVCMLIFYVGVTIATVLYAGALALETIFELPLIYGIWGVGIVAGLYTYYGGLKAVVWSDVIQGIALLLGGAVVTYLGFSELGGVGEFIKLSENKLHTVMPLDHPELPWLAVFFGGMWIPNLFYWGMNLFIMQRTLGAKSLEEGQKGILFGATLKLIIPFIVIFPGIIAYELYGNEIVNPDEAFPMLIKNLLPAGMAGGMLAALFGATLSTLDSLLNSAATIFTIDIYKPFINKNASGSKLVATGKITTLILMLLACIWAPIISGFEGGLYLFIQQYWGFLQSGVVVAFIIGMVWSKVPANAALAGMVLNFPIYGFFLFAFPDLAFLHSMALTLLTILAIVIIWTLLKPRDISLVTKKPDSKIKHTATPIVKIWSILLIVATISLYVIFF